MLHDWWFQPISRISQNISEVWFWSSPQVGRWHILNHQLAACLILLPSKLPGRSWLHPSTKSPSCAMKSTWRAVRFFNDQMWISAMPSFWIFWHPSMNFNALLKITMSHQVVEQLESNLFWSGLSGLRCPRPCTNSPYTGIWRLTAPGRFHLLIMSIAISSWQYFTLM